MKLHCPSCQSQIPVEDINVQKDIAMCRPCNEAFAVSDAVHKTAVNQEALDDPPKGAWLTRTPKEAVIGATTRSKGALFLLPFTLVWAGGSLGGIYGTQIASGEFQPFLSLFGIPFLIGSVFLIGMTLMSLFGKVEIRFDYHGDRVFTGIGPFGWTRKFVLAEVESIKEEAASIGNDSTHNKCIVMEGKRRLKFASMLSDGRRYFMLNALRAAHQQRVKR